MNRKSEIPANILYTAAQMSEIAQSGPITSMAIADMPFMPSIQTHKRSISTSDSATSVYESCNDVETDYNKGYRPALNHQSYSIGTRSPNSSYSRSVQSDTGSLRSNTKRVSFHSLPTPARRRPHYVRKDMTAQRSTRRVRPYASKSSETLTVPHEIHQLYRSGRKSLTMPNPLHVLDRTSLHECAIAMNLPEPAFARESHSTSSYRDSVTNLSMTTVTSNASSITSLGNLSRQDLHAHLKEETEAPTGPELELPLYNNGPTLHVGIWRLRFLRCLLVAGFIFPPLWLLGAIIGGRKKATYEEYRIRRYCRVALIVLCIVAAIAAVTYLIVKAGALNSGTARAGINPMRQA